jgi:hypothetical protein
MRNESDKGIPAELREVERRLREDRPALSALELDEIKVRTLDSAPRPATMGSAKKKGRAMKSRLTVVMVLALGLLMCGSGAAFAASGSSGSGSAGSAQYPEENEKNSVCEEESGAGGYSGPGCEHSCAEIEAGAEATAEEQERCAETPPPSSSSTPPPPAPPAQPAPSSGGSLPYTGFPTAAVLLLGLGLVGAGAALRMRLRAEQY